MPLAIWPATVRTRVLEQNYQFQPAKQLVESEMERGHKLRRTATGTPEEHTIRLRLPLSEFQTFEDWFKDDGGNPGGASQFSFPHPRTQDPKTVQIIPQDGRPFVPSLAPGLNWFVDLTIRIYP